MNSINEMKNTTPVLYLIFNRPEKVRLSFEQIRAWRPSKLYISADGPRHADDKLAISNCFDIIKSSIDWDCEIKINKFESNLGCKNGVMGGIDWFFSHEKAGIICEDDVVLALDFFDFASFVLAEYKENKNIFLVSADGRATNKNRVSGDFYCTKYPSVWGWATWEDRWKLINRTIPESPTELEEVLNKISFKKKYQWYWSVNFQRVYFNKIDTWDFHLSFYHFKYQLKSIVPSDNLMRNIGYDSQGTHTTSPNPIIDNLELGYIKSPYNEKFDETITKQIDEFYQRLFARKNILLRIIHKLYGILK